MLALANKESLIIGGPLVAGRAAPGQIVPVDSEHSALAQCLRGGAAAEVRRLVLTASGGPFRGRSRAELADVTPDAGAGPPDLGHGPGGHDQLGHAGEQGPGGDRGAPAVRHRLRPDRGGRAPAVGDPLDGRVHRRRRRSLRPARRTCGSRSRWAWAGRTGCPRRGPAVDWTRLARWTFQPLDEEAFPAVALAREAGPCRRHRTRRHTTRPTRTAWRPSWRAGSPFLANRRYGGPGSLGAREHGPGCGDPGGRARGGPLGPGPRAGTDWRGTGQRACHPKRGTRGGRVGRMTLLGWIIFIFALLFSIMLHEVGHFVTAKKFHMKVTQFFVGFGQTLWSRPARRDRVRHQGAAGRRLRQDRRDDRAGGRRTRRTRIGRSATSPAGSG